jgi:hypothetical protein
MPDYVIRKCPLEEVRELCRKYHSYGGAGGMATYAFGVYEGQRMVAGYTWQPPPPNSAKSTCPGAPYAVLALSRMAAVPRDERELNHVSRPLRHQMKHLIDRTRWPVLVTYSDEGEGHTGHVYKCSGWTRTVRKKAPVYVDENGVRKSRYADGQNASSKLTRSGTTMLQRWEHWIREHDDVTKSSWSPGCPPSSGEMRPVDAAEWVARHGWRRVLIPGKTWSSGAPAARWQRVIVEAEAEA